MMLLSTFLYGGKVDGLLRDEKGRFLTGSPSEKRKKWVGERFGKLLVVDVEYGVPKYGKNRTMCKCVCDCGSELWVVSDQLTCGRKSCGCDSSKRRGEAARKDLTGQRFGRLIVVEMLWVKPHTKCRCVCDCGNEIVVINTGLTSGKTQSCGCYRRDQIKKYNTKDFSGMCSKNGIKFIKRHKQTEQGVWIWECECPYCNGVFYDIPAYVNSKNKSSCGCVSSRTSSMEEYITDYLKKIGALFEREYTFEDCRDRYSLRFDFAILDTDNSVIHLIEYDGEQHFKSIDWFGGDETYEIRKKHDRIKDKYCKENNIPLTRLPYTMSVWEIEEKIKSIINP